MGTRRSLSLTVHEAVLQNDLKRIRHILRRDKKASVDKQDDYQGATPLMLAALIGSAKLVKYLLHKGASWHIQDRDGKVAADYAQGSHAEKMRRRSVYRGLMRKSTSTKRFTHLVQHLQNSPALQTQYMTKPAGTLAFERHGKSLSVFKLIAKVRFPSPVGKNTTSACICPGDTVQPVMCAVSGWSNVITPGLVNGGKYMLLVREMAELFRVDLPASCYDNPSGEPNPGPHNTGRVQASHCEKLLGAYWVEQQLIHCFGSADLSRMEGLKARKLPEGRKRAIILLDHTPCLPCLLFLAAIQKATAIEITAFRQAAVREVSREKKAATGFCNNCTCANCTKAGKQPVKKQHPPSAEEFQGQNHELMADKVPLSDTYQTLVSAQLGGPSADMVDAVHTPILATQKASSWWDVDARTPTATGHHMAPSVEQTCPKGWIDWGRYFKPARPSPLLENPFEQGQMTDRQQTTPTPTSFGLPTTDGLPTFLSSPTQQRATRRLAASPLEYPVPASHIQQSSLLQAQAPARLAATPSSERSVSGIQNPISYQAGRSAFFQTPVPPQHKAFEVVLQSQPRHRFQEYQRVELPPSEHSEPSVSTGGSPALTRSPSERSNLSLNFIQQRQKKKQTKKDKKGKEAQGRMKAVVDQLNLRKRFAFCAQPPFSGITQPPLPSFQPNFGSGKPARTAGEKLLTLRNAATSRPKREQKLAARSTLLTNAQYRQQVVKKAYITPIIEDAAEEHDGSHPPSPGREDDTGAEVSFPVLDQ